MGLFKKAENQQGYLKMSLMGFPGSGKTFTGAEVAIGLVKMLKDKRPVFALDTEKGLDYVIGKFDKAGVELQLARTRAFVDLLAAVDEAEKNGALLFIDSITHFWQDVQDSFKRANNRQRLLFQDWATIKGTWNKFTERFLNSRVHIIMCGRAADTFDYFTDESGHKELEKTGTRLQAEKNLGYEPGLAVEMERVGKEKFKTGERAFINKAYIIKDRFDILDGQVFEMPTFETFLPHIMLLNIGGSHDAVTSGGSDKLFESGSDDNWMEKRKQVEIFKEEIEGVLTSYFPGRTAEEVKIKTDMLYEAYGTRSWKALDDMKPDELKAGIAVIKEKSIALIKAKSEIIKAQNKTKEAA